MKSRSYRLDRFISVHSGISRRNVRPLLAQGRISVDGIVARDISQPIGQFSRVTLNEETLQDESPVYIMLNKPEGVVSATKDKRHKTVVELLQHSKRNNLHIAGRLDFNSTGLLLLSNDGKWSRGLTLPSQKVVKRYRVRVTKPLSTDDIAAFARGMYFPYEGVTIAPATLKIVSDYVAEVYLCEGRYHQIKRMFGRTDNRVVALHRFAIGNLYMDTGLGPGQARQLTAAEVTGISA